MSTSSANGDLGLSPMQQKDCFYYVQYGRCRYGQKCKFNHPTQVVQEARTENLYTNYRQGIPCKFFRAGFCKYGTFCEFNHSLPDAPLDYNSLGLPMRLGEKECSFYMGNLWCGYGVGCKFHHPELQFPVPEEYGSHDSIEGQVYDNGLVGSSNGAYYPLCETSSPHKPSEYADNGNQ